MGADLLKGNLPYVHLWEMKPPLVFAQYALFLSVLGQSIPSVRLGGLLCVFISAFLLYRTGERLYSTPVGFWLAMLHIVFSSILNGQTTMTEHLILIPLVLVLDIFLLRPIGYKSAFVLGLLSSWIVLTRTNMAFFVLTLGLMIAWLERPWNGKSILLKLFSFSAGNLLPLGAIALVYFVDNNFPLLFKSVVTVPLAYASQDSRSLLVKSWSYLRFTFDKLSFPAGFALMSLSALGFLLIYRDRRGRTLESTRLFFLPLLALPIFLSLAVIGLDFEEYLIQLFPLVILISGAALSFFFQSRFKPVMIIALAFAVLTAMRPSGVGWLQISRDFFSGRPLLNDTGYRVSEHLNQRGVSGRYVAFFDYHIGYFLTDTKIPTKYVHPSHLGRDYVIKILDGNDATGVGTLQKILDKEPLFIIRGTGTTYMDEMCKPCSDLLRDRLKKQYEYDRTIDDADIFKLKISAGARAGARG